MRASKRFPVAEYYLIVLIMLAGYTPPFHFNPVSIGLSSVLLLILLFRCAIAGIALAMICMLANMWMFFALISEASEFHVLNADAMSFLAVGLGLFFLNLLASGVMLLKYTGKLS